MEKDTVISHYIIDSQEDEIKRISNELHEGVGQTLYSVFTGLEYLEGSMQEPAMKSYTAEIREQLSKTIQEIRLLSLELHPPSLASSGITAALKSYLKLYTSTYGIITELTSAGNERRLLEKQNIMLYRVCQEALGNIAKYADANLVHMKLNWEAEKVIIEIKDFGKGFDIHTGLAKRSGLAAMCERMELIGGTCLITSAIGNGTLITLSLPY
ncbi:sensor histidine kinase [Cytobacillus gottheilii]|uniref:histidine kinase n=1 Tax=Cytobacillus gottheilii TaxID=859144 RepID=A0ABX8F781_9BACI|nr:ATP-binding protein [Cytobacillus gottheilii]QVY59970.1 sensor histidine kinase [Cytobacillus gottheilii]